MGTLTVPASVEGMYQVLAQIGIYLEQEACPEAVRRQIQAALERKIFMENYDMKMVCSAAGAQELLPRRKRRGVESISWTWS